MKHIVFIGMLFISVVSMSGQVANGNRLPMALGFYCHSLFGRSQIDVRWRYQDDEINTDCFKSENSRIATRLKVRFYF